jgi:hypothetical protein
MLMKKLSKATISLAIILSVILFFIGLFIYGPFTVLMLPHVNRVKYQADVEGFFKNTLLFSCTLALIPVVTILIWRFGPVISKGKRMLTALIIVFAILISVLARRGMIKSEANGLPGTNTGKFSSDGPETGTVVSLIPMKILYFDLFAFTGLLAGSIIAYYTLRSAKNS